MGYKDKAKEREAAKKRKRKQRNVTPFEANVTPSSLSVTPLPPERVVAIEGILASRKRLGCPDDSAERWERADRYRQFELGGFVCI